MASDLDLREQEAARAAAVRAASRTLAEFLETDPEAAAALQGPALLPDRSAYVARLERAVAPGGLSGLRSAKRRALLGIAARDLAGEVPLEAVGAALADLADAALEVALQTLGAPGHLAVIGMGKLGGRELNYCSDIDVIFVAEGDLAEATKAAESLLRELGGVFAEGQAYRIDVDLRPEGRSGALVRSLDGALEYYRRWADPWEHQALIKARASAGAEAVGRAFVDATRPLVFPSEVSSERIAAIRKMKERVEEHAARSARRGRANERFDVKLGPGGIRDIEFAVQLLQLVHGGADPTVRSPSTLAGLGALVDGGYVADDDGAGLAVAYRWHRNVEHRLQLWQERRVHQLPAEGPALARLARVMGFRDTPLEGAADRFVAAHEAILHDVRRRFERLFYRPMVESLAEATGARLTPGAVRERLRVLGFRDVERAVRTLEALAAGTSRRARLMRVLAPAFMRWVAESPLPDAGLFAFLRLGEALGARVDALGALRDNPPGLKFLARVLGSGRILGEILEQVPEELALIAAPAGPGALKERDQLVREAVASLQWRAPEQRLDGLRRFKRREMLRVALTDLGDRCDVETVGRALSDVADACLEAALGPSAGFSVIGMGKLGGRELGYPSDLDVMFVHDLDPAEGERRAAALLQAIGDVTPEGQAFRIDAALRPEGKAGPLARSLDSFLLYYSRWSRPWEHQALIKARVAAGDAELGEKLLGETRALAFPEALPDQALAEIRRLKARMERERIPRGVEPRRHIKLGPGGLSDVEFAVQILQRRHAHRLDELKVAGTLAALRAARAAELLDEEDAGRLEEAYRFLARLRDRLFFAAGRPVDVLPVRPEDLEAAGIAMGYRDQSRQMLEERYLAVTRRCRRVAEKLIYG